MIRTHIGAYTIEWRERRRMSHIFVASLFCALCAVYVCALSLSLCCCCTLCHSLYIAFVQYVCSSFSKSISSTFLAVAPNQIVFDAEKRLRFITNTDRYVDARWSMYTLFSVHTDLIHSFFFFFLFYSSLISLLSWTVYWIECIYECHTKKKTWNENGTCAGESKIKHCSVGCSFFFSFFSSYFLLRSY